MCGTVQIPGWHFPSWIWEDTVHEILIKPFRALSRRHFINCIAMRPERDGSVANRNRRRYPASQHYGRRAEAGGKATEAAANGKAATAADASGKHSCISPDIANHSNAAARKGFDNGEVCHA
jgi:hypothetical protein